MNEIKFLKLEKPEKLNLENDNNNGCYHSGKLIKIEKDYVLNKVTNNNSEKEILTSQYTLTFLDNKTKEEKSFQSSFLPKLINENCFYCIDNNFVKYITKEKSNFCQFAFNNDVITREEGNCKETRYFSAGFFLFCIFIISFFFLTPTSIPTNIENTDSISRSFSFCTSIAVLGSFISIFVYYSTIIQNKKIQKEKKNIKNHIDKLL